MQGLEIFSLSWVLAAFTVFFAAFIRGVAGFGFALVLAPILLLIVDPKSVVVVNLLLGLFTHILVLRYGFRNVYLKGIVPMSICSLLGIPIGIWIITVIEPSALKVLIGGVTVLFAIPLILGFNRGFTRESLACGLSGFFSGILSTSTSLGGPPVVLLMHNQNWRREVIHSSLAAFFLFVCACSLVALAISGLVDAQIILSTASLVPALFAGIILGMMTFRRINPLLFRRLALVVVICTGILGILSGLGILT